MEDVSKRTELGEFDYPRAKAGGLDAAFMAVYVPAEYQKKGGARQVADDLIDLVEGLQSSWPEKFSLARSPSELLSNFERRLFSIPLGIENGAAIEHDLENLQHFYNRGVRYITLVHGTNNQLCDSSYDITRRWNGLSPLGRKAVVEMNRLGIMVDVSHLSDESFYDVMDVSQAPVIASHSSCRYFTPGWERNMDDKMIKLLAEKGGVIQINFGSMFLTQDYRESGKKVEEFLNDKGVEWDSPEATELIAELRETVPAPEVTISDVAAHIDHVVELVGIDHVGLGSDFDGVGGELPIGLEDVSCYPNLILELLRRDYSELDIQKICSANLLRVWTEVEKRAAELN
jgi:membrane dipeptidase